MAARDTVLATLGPCAKCCQIVLLSREATALASVAHSWLEFHLVHRRVVGWIPSQGTQAGCGFNTCWGVLGGNPLMFLSRQCFSLPLPS